MFHKLISTFIVLTILTNSVFAEPFEFYSKSNEPVENVFTFKPAIIPEDLNGLTFNLLYFPLTTLPDNIPSDFVVSGQGLFCLNTNNYDDIISLVKSSKFDLNTIVDAERKNCNKQKKYITDKFTKREDKLLEKISKIEKDLDKANNKYKDLEDKNFWIQVGAGAAVLAISGFAIYSSQK